MKEELRDRFGPLPEAAELMLKIAESENRRRRRRRQMIETKEDKLMLTRNNDFVMARGKFPRLTKTTARGAIGRDQKTAAGVVKLHAFRVPTAVGKI